MDVASVRHDPDINLSTCRHLKFYLTRPSPVVVAVSPITKQISSSRFVRSDMAVRMWISDLDSLTRFGRTSCLSVRSDPRWAVSGVLNKPSRRLACHRHQRQSETTSERRTQ